MLEIFKKNYVNICIVFVYTLLGSLVYGIWSYSAWHLWYVTLIIILVIIGLGCLCGWFWIGHEIKKQKESSVDNA